MRANAFGFAQLRNSHAFCISAACNTQQYSQSIFFLGGYFHIEVIRLKTPCSHDIFLPNNFLSCSTLPPNIFYCKPYHMLLPVPARSVPHFFLRSGNAGG